MIRNIYEIQHKIVTLVKNAVIDKDKDTHHIFSVDYITFEHWDYSFEDAQIGDAWIAKGEVESDNFLEAINIFRKSLSKIVPRIALISQAYIEYHREAFVIHKKESDTAFFHCTKDRKPVSLMFMKNEKQALDELLTSVEVPDEFYYYWNDAVNTLGYSAKLLLMFSALEALAKKRDKSKFSNPIDLHTHILGEELADTIFTQTSGLRHRLVHGEYLSPDQDGKKNYLDLVHKKIIQFFNKKILSRPLLEENVINPQRNFYGNKSGWDKFIKKMTWH